MFILTNKDENVWEHFRQQNRLFTASSRRRIAALISADPDWTPADKSSCIRWSQGRHSKTKKPCPTTSLREPTTAVRAWLHTELRGWRHQKRKRALILLTYFPNVMRFYLFIFKQGVGESYSEGGCIWRSTWVGRVHNHAHLTRVKKLHFQVAILAWQSKHRGSSPDSVLSQLVTQRAQCQGPGSHKGSTKWKRPIVSVTSYTDVIRAQ